MTLKRFALACAFGLAGPLVSLAAAAASTPLLIDDFTGGPAAISLGGMSPQTVNLSKSTLQHGAHILGGTRRLTLIVPAGGNQFGQVASIRVQRATSTSPAALVLNNGFREASRLEMSYGSYTGGPSLGLDLTKYDRFRMHFYGIALGALNFNIESTTVANVYSQWSCNISATSAPSIVDFPIETATVKRSAIKSVSGLIAIFQYYYGNSVGVTKFELIPKGASVPAADVTCP